MTEAVLCIGSNVAEGAAKIRQAVEMLGDRGIDVADDSGLYRSTADSPYLNCVVRTQVEQSYEALRTLTKEVEQALGRTPAARARGLVPVDIDIVLYAGAVVRPTDYRAPYFKIGYDRIQGTSPGIHVPSRASSS